MGMQFECLACKPGTMTLRPVLARFIRTAVAKSEGEQLLPGTHEMHGRIHSCSSQIAHGFVRRGWHPDRCQISGPVQDRQVLRVTPVCLDPISGLARNH
jgi:hypothetical protein